MKKQHISVNFTTTRTSLKSLGLMAKIGELSPVSATFEDKTVEVATYGCGGARQEIISDEVDISFSCEITDHQLLKIIEAMDSGNT